MSGYREVGIPMQLSAKWEGSLPRHGRPFLPEKIKWQALSCKKAESR